MNLFIEEYRRDLRAKIADHKSQVRSAVDWHDFKRRVGVIAGLEQADALLGDMLKAAKQRAGEDDEGDEE